MSHLRDCNAWKRKTLPHPRSCDGYVWQPSILRPEPPSWTTNCPLRIVFHSFSFSSSTRCNLPHSKHSPRPDIYPSSSFWASLPSAPSPNIPNKQCNRTCRGCQDPLPNFWRYRTHCSAISVSALCAFPEFRPYKNSTLSYVFRDGHVGLQLSSSRVEAAVYRLCTGPHLAHIRDCCNIPLANGLVECWCFCEHALHSRDCCGIPLANGLVEC